MVRAAHDRAVTEMISNERNDALLQARFRAVQASRARHSESRLGKVGSRLVGEVILGVIKWARESVLNDPDWTSTITNSRDVTLLDLAEFAAP